MFGSDRSKGSVLLMTLMFMICLTILSSMFLNMVMVNSTNASALVNSTQALYLAEAGINKAIYYLQATATSGYTAPDGSINAAWRTAPYPAQAGNYAPSGTLPASCTITPNQPCQESLDGGFSGYTMWVVSLGNKIQITSSGSYNGLIRTVQLLVTQPVLSSGLAGWWKFDEASSGTCSGAVLIDSSGNGNTGTCNNGPQWITGHVGTGAMSFNGSTQYGSTSSAVAVSGPITIALWINPVTVTTAKNGFLILEARQSSGTSLNYAIEIQGSAWGTQGVIFFADSNTSSYFTARDNRVLSTNTWQFVVFTADGSGNYVFYINGLPGSSGTLSIPIQSFAGQTLQIGISKDIVNNVPFYGSIDDIRIYNQVLSASEISQLYNSGSLVLPMFEVIGPSIVYGSRKEI